MARNRARGAVTEHRIREIASSQEGRVSRSQLIELGLGKGAIRSRLASSRLLIERPGVYALPGAPQGSRARCWVGLLDAGAGSLVSHFSAAAEWRMRLPSPIVVDITDGRHLSSRDGIRLHQREIHPKEVHQLNGLPITSPSQTLFDLTVNLGLESLARVANQGFVEQILTIDALHATLLRNAGRKGSKAFRRLIAMLDPEGRRIRSPLEARVSAFLRARGFPPWEQNARLRIGGETIEPDFLWREQRVILEADGRDPHLAPLTFDSDRRRDRRVRVNWWEPVRVTSADLGLRPDEFAADLWTLLGRNSVSGVG